MHHQCSASWSNFWASIIEYPGLGPNLQKHSKSWIPTHQVLSTSQDRQQQRLSQWCDGPIMFFSSSGGTEYLLLYNNLRYLGPNPSWIPDLIQLRRSFVPLQWKICLGGQKRQRWWKPDSASKCIFLGHKNKRFMSHKHCSCLPAQSVISPISIWLSPAWPAHTTVTCSAWKKPPFAHTAGNSFVH